MNWGAVPHLDLSTARAIREARESGAFRGKLAHSSLRSLLRGYATDFDRQIVHSRIARHQLREALGAGEPFGPPQLAASGLAIGQDRRGRWIYQRLDRLDGHWALTGSTGSGKSSLVVPWLAQLLALDAGLCAFDSYKTELRRMLPLAKKLDQEVIVLRAGDERINVLDPDGCDPRGYLPLITQLLARVLGLPPVATMLLQRVLFAAYTQRGAWGGQGSPCLLDAYEIARTEMADANHAARETLLARFSSLLTSLPHGRGIRRGWASRELERFKMVVELRSAAATARELRILHTLQHTMHRRNEGREAPRPLHLVIDDAQKFLTASGTGSNELTPLAESLGLVRSSGLNIWALFQSLHGVDPAVLANLNNKVFGRLGSAHDWSRAAAELFLNPDQERWARRNLGPGLFLAQLAHGWRSPFVLRMPRATLPPPPSDELVVASQAPLARLAVDEATEYRAWSPVPCIKLPPDEPERQAEPTASGTPALDESSLRFLAAVHDHAGEPSSSYPGRAGLSPRRARPIRDQLVADGLIRILEVQTTPRGRPSILLELTDAGVRALAAWRGTGGAS